MEYQIKDVTDVEKEISIQIPAAELQPRFDEAYKRNQSTIEIRGFRKGKVPLGMIKKIFGEGIEHDAISEIANETFKKIIEEKKIDTVGEPALTNIDYKRGGGLTFTIKYEVKPVVILKEYKNIPVEKIVHEVTDLELDGEIDQILRANAAYSPAGKVEGDQFLVTADVQELDEGGSPLIGKRTADMRINLSDAGLFTDVRNALIETEVGDVRRAKFEQSHGDHAHKNHIEITVKKIERITLPELNNEFVKKTTRDKVQTVEDFREKVRADLEEYWNDQSERQLNDSLISGIIRRHEFNVPETMIKAVTDAEIEEISKKYPDKKLPKQFDEEKYRQEYRASAIFQAKWFLIRDEIIKAENITADDADIEHKAEEDAPKTGIDKERLAAFYKSSPAVKDRIITGRLMDFLKANAQINEIDDRSIADTSKLETGDPERKSPIISA